MRNMNFFLVELQKPLVFGNIEVGLWKISALSKANIVFGCLSLVYSAECFCSTDYEKPQNK